MTANALFVATLLSCGAAIYLLSELRFLAPHRWLIWDAYRTPIALYAAAFFVNVFALTHLAGRRFFLKDTGEKLAHLEKQLRSHGSVSAELADRLKDQ